MSKTISVYLTDEASEKVQQYMEQANCSQSKAINDLITGNNTNNLILKYLKAIHNKVKEM